MKTICLTLFNNARGKNTIFGQLYAGDGITSVDQKGKNLIVKVGGSCYIYGHNNYYISSGKL